MEGQDPGAARARARNGARIGARTRGSGGGAGSGSDDPVDVAFGLVDLVRRLSVLVRRGGVGALVGVVHGGRGRRGVDDVVDVAERVGTALALDVVVTEDVELAVADAVADVVAVAAELALPDTVGDELELPDTVADELVLDVVDAVAVMLAVVGSEPEVPTYRL